MVTQTTRTQMIRQRTVDSLKSFRATKRGFEKDEFETPYHEGIMICLDRARLWTQSYKETEGQPSIIRRSKALAKVLENMSIYIDDEELIVGNVAKSPKHLAWHPELYCSWLNKAIDAEYKGMLSEEERKEAHGIAEYWLDKAVQGKERDYLPADVKPFWFYNGALMWIHGAEAGQPNYENIFRIGLNGIIKECEDKLKEIEKDEKLPADKYIEHRELLQAMIISLKAAVRFGQRYSELAKAMADKATNPRRKQELLGIADACSNVPGNPVRTLREALQCFFFIYLITRQIDVHMNGLGSRFDQITYPYYKEDSEAGIISREQAQELVGLLWLKLNSEGGQLRPKLAGSLVVGGLPDQPTITIGGVAPTGEDATNEMTFIALDASKAIRLQSPQLSFRYHDGTPPEAVSSAIDLAALGVGYPAFFNDRYDIPKILSLGMPIEDARNYCIEVCMRWMIPGKNMVHRQNCGEFVLPKMLELALNQGVDKFSGRKIGASTPDPHTFTSLEDVIQAYLAQLDMFMKNFVRMYNITDVLYTEYVPRPFFTALLDGGIDKGQDCRKWRYFAKTPVNPVGQVTVIDSLAAIKKLVFDGKRVTFGELVDALHNNWEGKEDLRQMMLTKAPKFGNDDDYVDMLGRDVMRRTTKVFESYKNLWGQHFIEDGSGGAAYYAFSSLTAATPDGRKDRDMFNDGTISPSAGMDKKGPTAVLKSVAKIDPMTTLNHLFNQKFLPSFLQGDNKEVFAAYLKTWAELGMHQVQFNVVTPEKLKDAQEHPENYRDLVVRVAGYCAYFVDLSKGVQDQIISRTWQCFS